MVARMQNQYMKPSLARKDAVQALKADNATAAFCSLYMRTAATSLGVLQHSNSTRKVSHFLMYSSGLQHCRTDFSMQNIPWALWGSTQAGRALRKNLPVYVCP